MCSAEILLAVLNVVGQIAKPKRSKPMQLDVRRPGTVCQ